MAPAQPKCLIFDLESIPASGAQPAVLTKIGALRPDTGVELELTIKDSPQKALQALDELAAGASFVLGHNIIEHDLPLLRGIVPDLQLLSLPAADTLRLSPLAFPQNPYHRLIKDYKLIRASLSSPLGDCRSTLTLFQDQLQAFAHLKNTHPQELAAYHALLAPKPGPGLGNVLLSITGITPPSWTESKRPLPLLLAENDPGLSRDLKVCRTRLTQLLEIDLMQTENHWPLAYALAWLRVSGGNSVLAPWVRHQFPAVSQLLTELRDMPCAMDNCQYCRTTHDPRHELQRYFGFTDFRRDSDGESLQHDIVLAGMRGESVLAVLATGGGKSLCYQLPALNRYHRNGS